MTKEKPLVFAALPRVSGEAQAKRGGSLAVQREQIIQAVSALGSDPKKICWFGGQEHTFTRAAAGERKLLDALLSEAQSDHCRFNALMVATTDRVGRNAGKTAEAHQLLKEHDIKFYVLAQHYDYEDPDSEMMLGIFGALDRRTIAYGLQKSMATRIKRAEEGKYTARALFGREWNEGLKRYVVSDPAIIKKWSRIVTALDQGETVRSVAALAGVNRFVLRDRLRLCGAQISFSIGSREYPKKYPKRKFTIEIPPLVADMAAYKRVMARFDGRKTIWRLSRQDKTDLPSEHVLKGLVHCRQCGYAYTAHTAAWKNLDDKRFKRGPDGKRLRGRKRNVDPEGGTWRFYRHNVSMGLSGSCYTKGREGEGGPEFAFNIDAAKLEQMVLVRFLQELATKARAGEVIKGLQKKNGSEVTALKTEIAVLEGQVADADKEIKGLIKLASRVEAEQLAERIRAVQVHIGKAQQALAQRRAALDAVDTVEVMEARINRIMAVKASFEEQWQHDFTHATPEQQAQRMSVPERREFLRSLLEAPGYGVFISKYKGGKLLVELRSDYPSFAFKMDKPRRGKN